MTQRQVIGAPNRSFFRVTDGDESGTPKYNTGALAGAQVAVSVANEFHKMWQYKVKAGEGITLGVGVATVATDVGRIQWSAVAKKSGSEAHIDGMLRFVITNPRETFYEIVTELPTEFLHAQTTVPNTTTAASLITEVDRQKTTIFPYTGDLVTENNLIAMYFRPYVTPGSDSAPDVAFSVPIVVSTMST